MFITRSFLVPIDSNSDVCLFFYTLKVMQQLFGYQYCSQYIILHSTAEGNPYRIRKTTEFSFWGETFLESMQPNIQYLLLPFLSIM